MARGKEVGKTDRGPRPVWLGSSTRRVGSQIQTWRSPRKLAGDANRPTTLLSRPRLLTVGIRPTVCSARSRPSHFTGDLLAGKHGKGGRGLRCIGVLASYAATRGLGEDENLVVLVGCKPLVSLSASTIRVHSRSPTGRRWTRWRFQYLSLTRSPGIPATRSGVLVDLCGLGDGSSMVFGWNFGS